MTVENNNVSRMIRCAAFAATVVILSAASASAGVQADVASLKPSLARSVRSDAPGILDFNAGLKMAALDAGTADGMQPGMRYAAVRDGRTVARLMVVDVRVNVSGAVAEMVGKGVGLKVQDRLVRELEAAK